MKDDKHLWVAIAIVLFVIGVEYLLARRKGKQVFRFQSTVSNLLMGVFDRIAGLFMIPLIYYYYDFLHTNTAVFTIPKTVEWFVFAVFLSDFIWYFYHRTGHRVNLFWGTHVVHHQSKDYNYSVALNLTPFQAIVRVMFWSLMPIIGFSAEVVLGTHLVIGLYQFLLHTTLVPKLGIIEKIFVTPSHHRVHHGSNPEYIDKNYGGVLIIWDRLFGSFQEEMNEVKYGITKDINSYDFLTALFHYFRNLIFQMKQLPTWKEKLILLVKSPDWKPKSGSLNPLPLYIEKDTYDYKKYSVYMKFYILANTVGILIVLTLVSYNLDLIRTLGATLLSGFVLLTIVLVGRLLEKRSTKTLEIVRFLLLLLWLLNFSYLTYW